MPVCSVILWFCLACSSSWACPLCPSKTNSLPSPPILCWHSSGQHCRHTHTHTDMRKHTYTYTATHLLIPVSLIPRHSPQIFPSADLIVRECVCVYISGGVGGGSATGSSTNAWVHLSLVEHFQFSSTAHSTNVNIKHQLCCPQECILPVKHLFKRHTKDNWKHH